MHYTCARLDFYSTASNMDKSIEFEKRSQDYLKTDRIHPKVTMSLYTGTQLQNGVNSAISRQHDLHAQDSFVRKGGELRKSGVGKGGHPTYWRKGNCENRPGFCEDVRAEVDSHCELLEANMPSSGEEESCGAGNEMGLQTSFGKNEW